MARQSLKKRKERYNENRAIEFDRLQAFFKRTRTRVTVGRYRFLTAQEVSRVESLLVTAIVEDWTKAAVSAGVINHTIFNLENARGTSRKILRILRDGGNRQQVEPTKSKREVVVIRRAKKVLDVAVPEAKK